VTATRISIGAILALGLIGCSSSSGPEPLTYEEFKAQAYQEPDTGLYITSGDELVETEEQMQELYQSYLDSITDAEAREDGFSVAEQGLIVNRVGGADDKWPLSVSQNLTYCIDQQSFGSHYSAVVSAMSSAASAWESAAGSAVNFVHVSSLDTNCSRRTSGVVFNLRQVNTNQYLARAFFPSTSRSGREILVAASSFGNIKPWSVAGVLRHEVGHTIGFRHEHTRPESGTCYEDSQWRSLTAYDSSSVMHYPQCNGTQNGDLVLTNSDKAGAAALY